jgi:hypothetical protein
MRSCGRNSPNHTRSSLSAGTAGRYRDARGPRRGRRHDHGRRERHRRRDGCATARPGRPSRRARPAGAGGSGRSRREMRRGRRGRSRRCGTAGGRRAGPAPRRRARGRGRRDVADPADDCRGVGPRPACEHPGRVPVPARGGARHGGVRPARRHRRHRVRFGDRE